MKIEITTDEHSALMELLNDMSELRYNQLDTLIRFPEDRDRWEHCLKQARAATRLLMKLGEY